MKIESQSETIREYLKTLTLLCVEDSKTTQTAYRIFLKEIVGELLFAYDGEEGLKIFSQKKIDIVLSDNYMPKLDGIDMIEAIRRINSHVPIILVTALEETEIIIKALQLNVTDFLRKPIDAKKLVETIEDIAKFLYAEAKIKEEEERKLRQLQEKQEYSTYQEKLAFLKELNILRNDLYYKLLFEEHSKNFSLVDIFYKPLDTLSGDAYSIRMVNEDKTLYCVVDGMGKGISAAQSAILLTSHINYYIDTHPFDFRAFIEDMLRFIKPILLDEETISLDLFFVDCCSGGMQYAKFAMPASLAQNKEGKIVKIKSNNPPLSKYTQSFAISDLDIRSFTKFLFFTDGIIENTTHDNRTYARYIEEDFLQAFTKEEFKRLFFEKVEKQEDDITLIFINKLQLADKQIAANVFDTTLEAVEEAGEWYSELWKTMTNKPELIDAAGVVFNELMMNAYEHGNLNITDIQKHILLEEDRYFDELIERENRCSKKLSVEVYRVAYLDKTYIITRIADEGEGFDTNELSKIFRNMRLYNGRGVYLSKRSSLGIYYNTKGNAVFFLHQL